MNTLYTGHTESQSQTEARALRMFEDYKINFQLTHTAEADADAVANMVDTAQAEDTWQLNAIAEEADAKDWQDQVTDLRAGG